MSIRTKRSNSLIVLGHKDYPGDDSLYELEQDSEQYVMRYSKLQSSWTLGGEIAYSLENDGNGFIFKSYATNETIKLDYGQAEMLRAFLHLENPKAFIKIAEFK